MARLGSGKSEHSSMRRAEGSGWHTHSQAARRDRLFNCARCWRQVPATKPENKCHVHGNGDLSDVRLLLRLLALGKRRERDLHQQRVQEQRQVGMLVRVVTL